MNTQSNVIYLEKIRLETSIEVSAANAIAFDPTIAVYESVKAIEQKISTLKDYLEEGKDILKWYMGDNETLVAKDGRKLATWNWVKGAVTIDRKALEMHFNDVFQIVKIDKSKEKTRRFVLE